MPELSQKTQRLIQKYQSWYNSLQSREEIATIHVDEIASKVAAFYEKIRGILDWQDEHLLRKAAIERVLKRRLFLGQNGEEFAANFVYELIRGGHFLNNRIPEQKIETIQRLINKYVFILNNSQPPAEKLKVHLYDWLLSIAACEVEEVLDPPRQERALIEYMEECMQEKISVSAKISEPEKNIQISIAVQKALFKLDKIIISYHLFKKIYPDWLEYNNPSNTPLENTSLKEIAVNIYSIWESIEKDLKHPLERKFYRICENYDTPYLILGDILSADPMGAPEKLKNPELLENSIREIYARKLKLLKSKAGRLAVYSTISIFVTKMLLAIAIEVPIEKYFTQQFNFRSLGLNILIPSILMLLLVVTVRPPGKSNAERVVMETIKITYQFDKKDIYEIRSPIKRGLLLNSIITLFYLATFLVSFGFIWWGLEKLNFWILSKIIFLIFFSLICYAGVKVRERSKELLIEEEKGGFLLFILDSFSMPFIKVGKWLSSQWKRYNILLVLMTALIEMPFQLFVEFIENWRVFLKEKKEEIH